MLAEFALTPQLFDEQAHTDTDAWRDQLRQLGSGMFPRRGPPEVVVSDLYGGSWRHVAEEVAGQISDSGARQLCQGILTRIKDVLVARPPVADGWPDADLEWGRDAIASHLTEPLDRIVTTAGTHAALAGQCRAVRCIAETVESAFWGGDWPSTSLPMQIAAQVDALRKLCVHADFLCLISPAIYGGADDETDFALGLLRSAFRRPSGFGQATIEIHTETPEPNHAHSDYQRLLDNRARSVSRAVEQALANGQSADVVIWSKLLDRVLIAGSQTDTSKGTRERRPRWGVAMSHIARKPDEKRSDFFTEWKLLTADSLGRWFTTYCDPGATSFLRRVRVIG